MIAGFVSAFVTTATTTTSRLHYCNRIFLIGSILLLPNTHNKAASFGPKTPSLLKLDNSINARGAALSTRPFQEVLRTSDTTTTSLLKMSKNGDDTASKPARIMVVGSANQDLISYTKIIPTIGETVMGKTFQTACGGKGANQAVAAASLSLTPVSMVCRVGDDIFGTNLLNNFRKYRAMSARVSLVGVPSIWVSSRQKSNLVLFILQVRWVLNSMNKRQR